VLDFAQLKEHALGIAQQALDARQAPAHAQGLKQGRPGTPEEATQHSRVRGRKEEQIGALRVKQAGLGGELVEQVVCLPIQLGVGPGPRRLREGGSGLSPSAIELLSTRLDLWHPSHTSAQAAV